MILIACHDVGPAKYLAALFSETSTNVSCISSSLSRQIFAKDGIETIQIREIEGIQEEVKLVITGTSLLELNQSIDKQLIKWALERNIPNISIVEHWSWYRTRFETSSGMLIPNYIILNDDVAMNDAIDDGLPKEILKSLGNPHLERLCSLNHTLKYSTDLREFYGLPKDKRIIVFVSEELKSCFHFGSVNFLGYDEFQVLAEIKKILMPTDYLLIKMHPEENPDKYSKVLGSQIGIILDCSTAELAAIADKVIGMASMLLLELALFRDDIISFRPNNQKKFIGEHLGVIIPINNAQKLFYIVNANFKSLNSLKNRFSGSRNRILKFISDCQL
jgi:hypothetical protein